MERINYQREMENILRILPDNQTKLLLHCCCGPCSTQVLSVLKKYFDITLYFYNPNIYPREEYEKRLKELIKVQSIFSFEKEVKRMDSVYDDRLYFEAVKGLESKGEGSERCLQCYAFRMEEVAKRAKEKGFDYFTTTLSISPYKNAQELNRIGEHLEKKYGVSYLYSDFKKKEGYKESIRLSSEYQLYRQEYCGCVFSLQEAERIKERKQNGKEI